MHINAPHGYWYTLVTVVTGSVGAAYHRLSDSEFSRKYRSNHSSRIDSYEQHTHTDTTGRAAPLQSPAHPVFRGPQQIHETMNPETGPDYEPSGHEGTVSENIHQPEPQRFADSQPTLSGALRFQDPDNPTAWIQSDCLMEVRP